MTSVSEQKPIDILEGVQPSTDMTGFSTPHWTAAEGVRFQNGKPRKRAGFQSVSFDDGNTVSGVPRSLYSQFLTTARLMIGTHTRLYSVIGTMLANITPLLTSTTAVANSLATHYGTLANNPIATVNGSKTITITDADAARYVAGDTYTLSGASTTNGVPNTDINIAHIIRSIPSATTLTVRAATAATSTGSGGGASVVRKDGLIRVTKASHGMANGDRVKIAAAGDTGGVVAAEINLEHIIRNVASSTFDVMTTGTATSSVSGGGGASTTYRPQIAAGNQDESYGQGYGMGQFGDGLFGVSKSSASNRIYPRIWFFDRFGSVIIMTPGNGSGVYEWPGVNTAAPTLVSGAPTDINYAFVSDNILVTFGHTNPNRIFGSAQGDRTNWIASSTNHVFEDDIEGAGRFISHAPVLGLNLIFTETQVYTMRFIGLPNVWEIFPLETSTGIIGPMARCVFGNTAYWMGPDNFYMWRGGNVEIIPSNSPAPGGLISTLHKYVFDNLNYAQKAKCFAQYNPRTQDIEFHYPSANSNECDRMACVNVKTFAWTPDVESRSAAEYPSLIRNPRKITSAGILYQHEVGNDADGDALPFSLTSQNQYAGKSTAMTSGLIPDSVQSGDISVTLTGYLYPQSANPVFNKQNTVSPSTEIVPFQQNARFWNWTIEGEEEGQDWIMGDWMQEIQISGKQ